MAEHLRILMLEDRPADAEVIQFEMQEAGLSFTAKVVASEKDFIHELQELTPDLILSDYDLPQYNGALALAETRSRYPDTPFILVTGAIGEDRAIEILTQGAKDYVLKTRLQQRLVPAIRRALAEAEEHRARQRAEDELREAHRTLEEKIKIRTAELEAEITTRKQIEEALRERVKELNCIYSIADLMEKTDYIDEIFQGTTDLMTYGWYYPEITCARITFKDREFKTVNFKETAWRMSSDLIVQRKSVGRVEICYLEERPDSYEGPFLKEERYLLNSIAERMGKVAERKQYEKEREGLISELQQALSEVKKLSGLLPICASCKNIRNDEGYWEQIEWYIKQHSEAEFSHGICPECARKLYPELYKKID
jgi:CheY-like chemotaxis protein